jgi:hypothetical protein
VDSTPVFESNDFIFLYDGSMLRTHPEVVCSGRCSIHNPSSHPLNTAPLNWRADRHLMERICDHGIGHPDPDDLAYKKRMLSAEVYLSHAYGIHGCDGCCQRTWIKSEIDELRNDCSE